MARPDAPQAAGPTPALRFAPELLLHAQGRLAGALNSNDLMRAKVI